MDTKNFKRMFLYLITIMIAYFIIIGKEKADIKEIMEFNEEVFEDLYDDYDIYINLIAKEIEYTHMNDSALDVYASYLNLQYNGLISLGEYFEYQTPDFEPTGKLGISIINGEGVCRNQAENLYEIFKNLEYDCGLISGELYKKGKKTGEVNHKLVYVKEDNIVYLFDPTNKTIFLRNIFGQYVSIENDKYYFAPDFLYNEMYEDKTSHMLFWYSNNDYAKVHKFRLSFSESFANAEKLIDYYHQYEQEYLLEYEKLISDKIQDYYEKITENKDSAIKLILENE